MSIVFENVSKSFGPVQAPAKRELHPGGRQDLRPAGAQRPRESPTLLSVLTPADFSRQPAASPVDGEPANGNRPGLVPSCI